MFFMSITLKKIKLLLQVLGENAVVYFRITIQESMAVRKGPGIL